MKLTQQASEKSKVGRVNRAARELLKAEASLMGENIKLNCSYPTEEEGSLIDLAHDLICEIIERAK